MPGLRSLRTPPDLIDSGRWKTSRIARDSAQNGELDLVTAARLDGSRRHAAHRIDTAQVQDKDVKSFVGAPGMADQDIPDS
jgi:hypothetical protein